MNGKNIKKQPSAQALDDDALENVAGGYYLYPKYSHFHAKDGSRVWLVSTSPEEKAYLQKLGYTPVDKELGIAFQNSQGDLVSRDVIVDLLKAGGFTED